MTDQLTTGQIDESHFFVPRKGVSVRGAKGDSLTAGCRRTPRWAILGFILRSLILQAISVPGLGLEDKT